MIEKVGNTSLCEGSWTKWIEMIFSNDTLDVKILSKQD